MHILDTDTLSIVQQGVGEDFARLSARITASGEPSHVTIVSFEEQMKGWTAYAARANTPELYVRAAAKLHGLLKDFGTRSMLDFTDAAAAEFRRLKAAKVRIGTPDLRIASIALANRATLASRNLRDFTKVPGLHVEDWTRPA